MTSSNSPLLSVIVPVYNTAPFLTRCLESLIQQTYRNLEIICVNDGSTDGSAAILDEYAAKDSRIKVIHQENAGVSVARNRGLDAATGEFVTFVDADDWLEPDSYEKSVPCMESDVDLVCFGTLIEGEGEAEEMRNKELYYALKYDGKIDCGTHEIMKTDAGIWNKIFRMSVVRRYCLHYPVGLAYGEDAAFFVMYASQIRKTYFCKDKLYHYWVHADSAMAKASRRNVRCVDHLKAVRNLGQFWYESGLQENRKALLVCAFDQWYWFALNNAPEECVETVNQLAVDIGREYGLLKCKRYRTVRKLLSMTDGWFVKLFHWYVDNRECYGFCGRAICSITYEAEQVVYRLFGKCVKTVRMAERA